ncbi:MAG TPA: hypothetical protein PK176_15485 [Acidobacteriota bacterium]|nr:hypothetical protein [Acidobacteriota bacterium]HQM64714.1 hypothetical protein [Acidobacteriota bacterium]
MMNRLLVLEKLKELIKNKSIIEKLGPKSEQGISWLEEARAYTTLVDQQLGDELSHYTMLICLPLSANSLGPIWVNTQGVIRTAIVKLEQENPAQGEKIYGPGDAYDIYRDLSQILAEAKTDIFIVDPYADHEVFDLYFQKIGEGVRIRLLLRKLSENLRSLSEKIRAKPGVQFEVRSSDRIHDRVIFIDTHDCWVIGQSIKDAGMNKPTYLLPVVSVQDMAALYEDAWQNGSLS